MIIINSLWIGGSKASFSTDTSFLDAYLTLLLLILLLNEKLVDFMKKKNFKYFAEKKLDNNIVYNHFRDLFLKVIDKIDTTAESESLDFFFNNIYYPSIPLKDYDKKRRGEFQDIPEAAIGESEWELLAFATGFQEVNDRILLLSGKVGTGKSTLINYVFNYLAINKQSVSKRVAPVLISCHNLHSDFQKYGVREELLHDYLLNDILKKHLSKILIEETSLSNDKFWNWYAQNIITTYLSVLQDYKELYEGEDLQRKIRELRMQEKQNADFYLQATNYLNCSKKEECKNVIIIFDNIDPFEISIIQNIYWLAKYLTNKSSSIRIIISLRETTYRKLYHQINEIKIVRFWRHQIDFLEVLRNRCDSIHLLVTQEYSQRPLVINVNNKIWEITLENSMKLLSLLISSILKNTHENALLIFSNDNIRSQLKLLTIVFSSGMIPESVFGKILLSNDDLDKVYTIPTDMMIRAIVTFGYPTYFTTKSKELSIPGVMNILSCAYNQEYICIFAKLFILRYLESRKGAMGINVSKMREEWGTVFGKVYDSKVLEDSFKYGLYRLLNVGLIQSPDIKYLDNVEELYDKLDEVTISDLGHFYLDNLIVNPEYLFYIKDDVYVSDIESFEGCIEVTEKIALNKRYWMNFYNTILFLKQYGQMELNIIRRLNEFGTLPLFLNTFSCKSSPFITLHILYELRKRAENAKTLKGVIEQEIMEPRIFSELSEMILEFEKEFVTMDCNYELSKL